MVACKRHFCFLALLSFLALFPTLVLLAQTGLVKGRVIDRQTQEPLPGATVMVAGKGVAANADGLYTAQLPEGTYVFSFSYISYRPVKVEKISVQSGRETTLNVEMEPEGIGLDEITVTAERRSDTDLAILSSIKSAAVVMSGVSSQTIARTQDRDAAEVVKRIPGISIIGDRFIIIRGLAQRYNNAWLNGMALPSSEADSRAFSFDMIPGSQIDNMMIVKTPAAEYPADYAGGFVLIRTKAVADDNSIQVAYGTGIHSETHFRDFNYNKGSGADFLGFDSGLRQLKDVPPRMSNESNNMAEIDRVSKTGFNNDWSIKTASPLLDQRLNMAINRSYSTGGNGKFGMALTLNYSNTNKTIRDMENAQFGVYSVTSDRSEYLFKYTDNLYTNDVRVGGMLNFSFIPKSDNNNVHKFEFRNIFNQLGRNRYTLREGWRNVSALYEQLQEEYAYQSRSAYSGQLSGSHLFGDAKNDLSWNAGYSYSNRHQPDRRIVERQKDPTNGVYEYAVDQSDISRYFTTLHEHVFSGAANYIRQIAQWDDKPVEFKTGVYGTYAVRSYRTRNFIYIWNVNNTLPAGFESLPTSQLMAADLAGAPDKIYVRDETDNTDNYDADKIIAAGYAAFNIPLHRFNLYAGVRFEHSSAIMTAYTQIATDKKRYDNFNDNNLFPSVNISYNITPKSLLRVAYGVSVNRQEFRELTPSTYYDFDLFSRLSGNPNLKQATIHNVDLRYELYPDTDDVVSAALFLKRFQNPIELTFFDTGGGVIQYTYENAHSATNYGVEIDARKQLAFIGLPHFTATLNLALIRSKVHFEEGGNNHDRPMQGQSPYIINAGLFYRTPDGALSLGLFYNRIGERIIGLGRVGSNSINNDIPDLYERSRNLFDFTFAVRLNAMLELRGAVRDILAEQIAWVQYPKFTAADGTLQERTQTTRSYAPGRSFMLTLSAHF
jgi:TonB-dependent receptor